MLHAIVQLMCCYTVYCYIWSYIAFATMLLAYSNSANCRASTSNSYAMQMTPSCGYTVYSILLHDLRRSFYIATCVSRIEQQSKSVKLNTMHRESKGVGQTLRDVLSYVIAKQQNEMSTCSSSYSTAASTLLSLTAPILTPLM
jgi:hypothetical protein